MENEETIKKNFRKFCELCALCAISSKDVSIMDVCNKVIARSKIMFNTSGYSVEWIDEGVYGLVSIKTHKVVEKYDFSRFFNIEN